MKTKTLFITCNRVKDSYGITSGLFNSARFVSDFLNTQGYESRLVAVQDANSIDRVVTEFGADVVIIEALWVSPAKFAELLAIPRHANRRWIVRIHSKAPFLANEGLAFKWMSEYTEIGGIEIAPNTKELTRQLRWALPEGRWLYLPNVYHFREHERHLDPRPNNTLNIGCFGAIRPMKNTFHQALAAIEFCESRGKHLRFHVNSSRIEQSGDNVVRNLRALFEANSHELVEHRWYHHAEFLKAITEMDFGVQVSFSESFNIVTADFVAAGVPIVASDDISWMPWLLRCKPTSQKELLRRMTFAYRLPRFAAWLQRVHLHVYNYVAKTIWLMRL